MWPLIGCRPACYQSSLLRLLLLLLPVAAAISAVSPFSSRRTHYPSTLSARSARAARAARSALGPRHDWPDELAPSGLRGLLGAGCWVAVYSLLPTAYLLPIIVDFRQCTAGG
jgi:hypothetical protein